MVGRVATKGWRTKDYDDNRNLLGKLVDGETYRDRLECAITIDLSASSHLMLLIEWMRQYGDALSLDYSKESDRWEANWIAGKMSFHGIGANPLAALQHSAHIALKYLTNLAAEGESNGSNGADS